MSNCAEIVDFCFDYLEGSMPEAERARFRKHLELCPDCVGFFDTYRRTPELTREALSTKLPPSVRQSIRVFLKKNC